MENTKNYSWKNSKTATNNELGILFPLKPGTSATTIKLLSPPPDDGKEEEMVLAVVKRRFISFLSRK